MLKNIFKIVLLLLTIGAVFILVSIFKTEVDEVDNINQEINESNEFSDDMTASTIIKQVEYAYSQAYMKYINYPTLEQVKSEFMCDNVIWNEDYVIEAQNFICKVEINNNNLKVNCLDYKIEDSLILSN